MIGLLNFVSIKRQVFITPNQGSGYVQYIPPHFTIDVIVVGLNEYKQKLFGTTVLLICYPYLPCVFVLKPCVESNNVKQIGTEVATILVLKFC